MFVKTKFFHRIVCSVYNIKPVMLTFSILNVPGSPLVEQLNIIPFMFSGILEIVAVAVPFIPLHCKTMPFRFVFIMFVLATA